jgi:hypothetical protein
MKSRETMDSTYEDLGLYLPFHQYSTLMAGLAAVMVS